jgi:hypothetical protein
MCFLFQGRDDSVETLNIGGAYAMDNGTFQCGQMTLNPVREFSPLCRWSHHECPAICFVQCSRDQTAPCQTIENAGERRSLMAEAAMQMADIRAAAMSQER